MKKCNLRSGSALLIVLGMLTFLIVSAVGFSAYMRQGRLPSSQLRRTVAARHLVKAAVAEAIDTIDQAINDNPHPGVGERSVDGYNRNVWRNRIFIGTNDWNDASFDFAKTVSPLCLEALAYIPPTLINEARYYSRLSSAAEWKSFDYGVGRYAFCAIDVSDYFDVNRLFANKRRSSAPHERISLAYLFDEGGADKWDTFIESATGRTVKEEGGEKELDIKEPLISIADLNLALNAEGDEVIKSAFCSGLDKDGEFCKLGENGEDDADRMLANMTFVTDSLFPKTRSRANSSSNGSSNGNVYDLADLRSQPFKVELLSESETDPKTLSFLFGEDQIFSDDNDIKRKWFTFLGLIGMVPLYDYLDANSVPLSLAIPTTERVPMVCAIKPELRDMEFAIRKEYKPSDSDETSTTYQGVVSTEPDNTKRTVKKEVQYYIDKEKLFSPKFMGTINAVTVFPFPRIDDEDKNKNFAIDGQLKFFFSPQLMPLRTEKDSDVLHLKEEGNKGLKTEFNEGIASINLSSKVISFPETVTQQADAIQEHIFEIKSEIPNIIGSFDENYLLKVTYEWDQTPKKDQNGNVIGWEPKLDMLIQEAIAAQSVDNSRLRIYEDDKPETKFSFVGKDGGRDSAFDRERLTGTIKQGVPVHLNCAIWLRVKEGEKQVVDMVPACLQDDVIQNKTENSIAAGLILGDGAYPLMCFKTEVSFDFSILGLEGLVNNSKNVDVTPKAVMVADPRYNHSPEDWFTFGGEFTKDSWLEWLNSNVLGRDGRDKDIFMATSDAGYLQSVYELAFLPRVKDPLETDLTKYLLNTGRDSDRVGFPTSFNDSNNGTKNGHLAWRTYDPFENDVDAFLNASFVNEGNGFKVNPYSDSKNVLTAVFANTPLCWRYASTNAVGEAEYPDTADEFNELYAFSENNEKAKVEKEDWEKIAQKFIDEIRSANRGTQTNSWENVFLENMGWDNDAENNFLGIDMSNSNVKFWGVDKKFLYGFWKDCFAVKQQLFLVFVRAEPTMMGSGATGYTPPQLGGKAVALVWRDPNPLPDTSGGSGSGTGRALPHRTRVLFYRQFE